MSIKDAIDLLFAARERIDFYWNFYVVVVIAVVGWIVTRNDIRRTSMSSNGSGTDADNRIRPPTPRSVKVSGLPIAIFFFIATDPDE